MLQPLSKPPKFLGLLGNPVDGLPHSAEKLGMLGYMNQLHSDISQHVNEKSGASP